MHFFTAIIISALSLATFTTAYHPGRTFERDLYARDAYPEAHPEAYAYPDAEAMAEYDLYERDAGSDLFKRDLYERDAYAFPAHGSSRSGSS